MVEGNEVGDVLLFTSGVIFLIISIVFISLFIKYRKRDYMLISLASIASAAELVVTRLDVLFPEDWESFWPDLLAGIFSLLTVLLILFVLVFPHKVPIDFEEKLLQNAVDEE